MWLWMPTPQPPPAPPSSGQLEVSLADCSCLITKPGAEPSSWEPPPHPHMTIPDDVDVAILGCQVQGAGAIGVSGVSWPGLQQGCAHVAAQEQLDHLEEGIRVGGGPEMGRGLQVCPDSRLGRGKQNRWSASQLLGDLPQRGRTHRPSPEVSCPSCLPCTGWTGAAGASQTAGPTGHSQPQGVCQAHASPAPCRP